MEHSAEADCLDIIRHNETEWLEFLRRRKIDTFQFTDFNGNYPPPPSKPEGDVVVKIEQPEIREKLTVSPEPEKEEPRRTKVEVITPTDCKPCIQEPTPIIPGEKTMANDPVEKPPVKSTPTVLPSMNATSTNTDHVKPVSGWEVLFSNTLDAAKHGMYLTLGVATQAPVPAVVKVAAAAALPLLGGGAAAPAQSGPDSGSSLSSSYDISLATEGLSMSQPGTGPAVVGVIPTATLNKLVPITMIAIDTVNRCYERGHQPGTAHEIAHDRHEIIADNTINSGLTAAGALLGHKYPNMALPFVGIVATAEVAMSGIHSPFHKLGEIITDTLDFLFGDLF